LKSAPLKQHLSVTSCANCGATQTSGHFCSQCGQKLGTAQLTLKELLHELWHSLTHTDKGIFKLVKDLFLHPKLVYTSYFKGQRKKYFSPVLFFILTAGLLTILYPYVFNYEDQITHRHNEWGREIYHFTKYRALLLLPFQALLTWLFFYKRYNLAEITVFWLYTLGLTYAIRLLLLPLYIPLISYKGTLDDTFTILSSIVILWQMVMLFGRVSNLGWLLLIVNLSYILDFVFQLYIIFGFHFFNNTIGINSWYDLIKIRYSI
jgi:ribosomal protein L32